MRLIVISDSQSHYIAKIRELIAESGEEIIVISESELDHRHQGMSPSMVIVDEPAMETASRWLDRVKDFWSVVGELDPDIDRIKSSRPHFARDNRELLSRKLSSRKGKSHRRTNKR